MRGILRDLSGPPNSRDAQTIRNNVLNKYRNDQVNGTVFDPKSIMLYSFPAEWTTDGFRTEANEVLSELDRSFVAGAKMYSGRGVELQFVELPVFEPKPTATDIGKPSEEDRFRILINSAGRR